MSCQRCESERVADFSAKCSDLFDIQLGDKFHDGYVLDDLSIGGGDYINIEFCFDCGQMQGDFPLPDTTLEIGEEDQNED